MVLTTARPHSVMSDEVFVAGLIHDIGTLVERQTFPDEFAAVISRSTDGSVNFLECERQVIGADHQVFGVALTTKWKFPRHLRAAVGFHHNAEALSVELRNMATLIQMADVLCCQEKTGFCLTAQDSAITDEMLDSICITQAQLDEIRDTLSEQLAEAELTLTS